jgi:tetratricopeptide (TPR) repeat protein
MINLLTRAVKILMIVMTFCSLVPWAALGCSLAETTDLRTATAFQLGLVAAEQKDYGKTIAQFTQAIEQSDHLAAAYSNRCLAYLQTKHFQAAIDDCSEALNRDRQQTEAYLNRGIAHHQLGDYAAAIQDANQLLKSNVQDFRAYFNRGLAKSELNQPQQALEDYAKAIEYRQDAKYDEISAIYTEAGLSHFELKNFDGAAENLTQAIAWNKSNSQAYYNRGCVYSQQKNYAAALQDFDRALALNGQNAEAYLNRGVVAYNLGQMADAQQDLQQAAQSFWHQGRVDAYKRTIDLIAKFQQGQASALG